MYLLGKELDWDPSIHGLPSCPLSSTPPEAVRRLSRDDSGVVV